jgi:hypothetical protein
LKKLAALLFLLSGLPASQAALSWSWAYAPSDTTASNAIVSAMNQAVAVYNTYSDYTYTIPVAYNSGVPTAQASYHGWIEFGGSISYRVAMHEMSHWLGTGTTSAWTSYNSNPWTGGYINNNVQAYDGPAATEGCDSQHYWPYGWNYDSEAVNPERLVGLVGAFLRDQGLEEDRTTGFAPGTYRLRNRVTIKMLDTEGATTNGAPARQYTASGSANQQWVLSLVSGTTYFTLQSVGNGKYLDSLGNTTDGGVIALAAATGGVNQRWQVVKTDGGFYKIINVGTGKSLDTGGLDAEGAALQGWTSGSSRNQQWKFVHVTQAAKTPGLLSQFRPVTASSTSGAHLPENAVDGNSTVTRWTASGGGFPQWWRVDLGAVCTITNVITYWYPGWTFKYRIETSTNDVSYTMAVDATANTVAGYTTNSLAATGRYLRITATGISPSGGWASFYDCQVFGAPQTPATPVGGLMHRYDFAGNANDSVGTAHGTLRGSATISGGALVTTAVAGGLSSGAPQNGAQLPPGAVSGITGPFSLESWFVANYGGGYTTLFSFSGNNTGSYILATPARGNSPYASSVSVIGGGGGSSELQASEQYQDNGALHQLVVTYDGSVLSYYIDGALGSFSGLPPAVTNSGLVLATLTYIGINGGSPWADNSINGSTRDFRIYGQALTASQIARLYALGSDAANATISATLLPPAPAGLAATPADGRVGLTWNASSGALSYNVKRAPAGGTPATLTNVAATSFSDASVVNGTLYSYAVSALSVSGESTNSVLASARPVSATPPLCGVVRGMNELQLSWPVTNTGWRLQAQTNALATGLGTNWVDIQGAAATNWVSLPIVPDAGSVFYRLVYP